MRVISKSVEETKRIGRKIAGKLRPASIVALFGELGSGKTVLVKGMAEGLGLGARCVLSPSFTLMREYKAKIPIYHFDLYRLKKTDMLKLGFDEYFYGKGISVIESADRIKEGLPKDCMRIEFSILGENERLIKIK